MFWFFALICAYLSILNDSSFLFVWTLSVEWTVVVCCCFCDLYIIVTTPFFDCAVLVVWLSQALTYCFTAVSARPFSVQGLGLYGLVYYFGAFTTLSMIAFWTCGAVGRWINCCLLFSLGCSIFYDYRWLSLQVCCFLVCPCVMTESWTIRACLLT